MIGRLIRLALNNIPRKYLIRISYLVRKISRNIYVGNNVECPVCESHYRKFLSYGYHHIRKNALCPKCLSLERHRLIWLFLKEKTDVFTKPKKMLHIAPEQCFEERFRKMGNIEYITADLESPLAQYKCDIQDLPFRDNEFDMVMCNHVLEHVDNDHKAMSEILRVMKPGAIAIILVPLDFSRDKTLEDPSINTAAGRKKHYLQYDHQRLYGLDFPDRLKNAGFIISDPNFADSIDHVKHRRYALPERELMYAYRKT